MTEGGLEARAQSWERERWSLGSGFAPAPLSKPCGSPAPAHRDARADPPARRNTRLDWLRLREAGFGQVTSHYWLTLQNFAQSTRLLPSPRPGLSPACNLGGGRWRLLVSLVTVSGPRRPGNSTRPPVSLRRGPSGHPDNRYPFRSTISPSLVTLATFVRPTILLLSAGIFAPARLLSLLPPISGLREGHCSHPGRVFWHWSPSRAEAVRSPSLSACSHSCVGLSIYHRELFRMQAMSLPC